MFSKLSKLCLTLMLTATVLFPAVPLNKVESSLMITRTYDQEASRMVVEALKETDLNALAAAVDAQLVRTGPLDYCTLQFKGADSVTLKESLRKKVSAQLGVLSAEWSSTYKSSNDDPTNKISVSISDPEYHLQWALKKIRANSAWDEGATGKGIVIAVMDTGVDLDHPDLLDPDRSKNNLVQGYDAFTRSSLPGAAQDDNGHGTSVAGVIAALNNSKGIVGIAYEAKIMPVKVMDKNGGGEDSIIADGIIWAADHGARIINLSIGSDPKTKIWDDALQYAAGKGCLLIAAAGNKDGHSIQAKTTQVTGRTNPVAYPGANPNVLAVSALDMDDKAAAFSQTGPEVALAAPGKGIFTDYWSEKEVGCTYSSGTSFAAPLAAGAAALLWGKYPGLKAQDIKNALISSAYDLGEDGRDDLYGYGRIDVSRALKMVEQPVLKTSPAEVGWDGGKIIDSGTAESAEAQITIPCGTFPLEISSTEISSTEVSDTNEEEKVFVSLNKIIAPKEFPYGITPASATFSLSWGGPIVNKVIALEIKLRQQDTNKNKKQPDLAYLYRWSGSRWLRVGGGVAGSNTELSVTIYEPGIYRAGYSPEPQSDRISGEDRILTAIEIARQAFPTGADTVIVAGADDFPDALAGAPLAYKYHAPLLLTPQNALPSEVCQLISYLEPRNIFILGGIDAVSNRIEDTLTRIAPAQRISGENRYATASAVAGMLGTKGQAVIVNGSDYFEAAAIAAQAAVQGKPILLTSAGNLAGETEGALRKLAVTNTEIIGNIGEIPSGIEMKLPNPIRYGGENCYDTSASVMRSYYPQGRILYLVSGTDFPDALTGAALAACGTTNIILLPSSGPTQAQVLALGKMKGKKIVALGGEGAVSREMLQSVQKIVQ